MARKTPQLSESKDVVHIKLRTAREFHKMLDNYVDQSLLEKKWEICYRKRMRGTCNFNKNVVTIPTWTLNRGYAYALHYVIHEFTHILCGPGHGKVFQSFEDNLLKTYGLTITRDRVYANGVYYNGERKA